MGTGSAMIVRMRRGRRNRRRTVGPRPHRHQEHGGLDLTPLVANDRQLVQACARCGHLGPESAAAAANRGAAIETAALLAGRRRLRPIFLTTMAAPLGVTPMILSRSPLWSPMASVIAVGLVVSMIFALVLVPILYVVVERREERRTARHGRGGNGRERSAGSGGRPADTNLLAAGLTRVIGG